MKTVHLDSLHWMTNTPGTLFMKSAVKKASWLAKNLDFYMQDFYDLLLLLEFKAS